MVIINITVMLVSNQKKKLKNYITTVAAFLLSCYCMCIFFLSKFKKKKLKISENHTKKFDPWEVQFYRSLEVPKLRLKWCFKI